MADNIQDVLLSIILDPNFTSWVALMKMEKSWQNVNFMISIVTNSVKLLRFLCLRVVFVFVNLIMNGYILLEDLTRMVH